MDPNINSNYTTPTPVAPVQSAPVSSITLASSWSRFWAAVLDGMYIGLVIYIPFFVLQINIDNNNYFIALIALATFAYNFLLIVNRGWTYGKHAYGLKVIHTNTSEKITYKQGFIREFTKYCFPFIPLVGGFLYIANGLMIVFSKNKQGLHDRLAKTQVIKAGNPWPMKKQIIFILIPLIVYILLGFFNYQKSVSQFGI